MTGPRRHTDGDGPWWDLPGLARWRGRMLDDGTIQARDREGRAADVTVHPRANQPGRLLVALCGSAEFRAAHPDL